MRAGEGMLAQELIDRAARRVEWSARALEAAADDLLQAGWYGAVTSRTNEQLRDTFADVAELLARIEADRKLV